MAKFSLSLFFFSYFCIVFSLLKNFAALSYSVGALAALPNIDAALETIAIRTWKAYAKRHGATGTIIKGIKTLKQINPDMAKLCKSDDEADAILMAMAYFDKKGTTF